MKGNRHMRARLVSILLLLALGAVVASMGCKSVATTSAILRNQEGNYDLAIQLCKEALQANPNDAEAHFQLGFAYSHLDSVELAYQHFMKSAELDPKKQRDAGDNIQSNFAKHYKLGQNAFNRADYRTATTEFELATKADPRQAIGHYNLGSAYFARTTKSRSQPPTRCCRSRIRPRPPTPARSPWRASRSRSSAAKEKRRSASSA
jgi:Flp pilus assembly protein TadD